MRQGVAVRELLTEGDRAVGVRADVAGGGSESFRADAVIDASGRDTFLASKLGWKRRDPDLTKIAVFTYYRGAKRDPGLDEGATTVAYIPEKGWFWYIPLPDDIVSVGVVAEADYLYRDTPRPGGDLRARGGRLHLDRGPPPRRHAGGAGPRHRGVQLPRRGHRRRRLLPGRRTRSRSSTRSSPPASSWPSRAGEMAADAVHRGLEDGAGGVTAATFADYERDMRWALDQFRQLVLSFYNQSFSFQGLHPGPPGPAPAAGRCPGRQRLRGPRSAVRRPAGILGPHVACGAGSAGDQRHVAPVVACGSARRPTQSFRSPRRATAHTPGAWP